MLRKLKTTRGNDHTREMQLQQRVFEDGCKSGLTFSLDRHSMKRRIRELEEEVENLRSTVKFLQDTYLLDDE